MSTKFDVEEISQILEMMKENGVSEFRLELEEGKLWLKRGPDYPAVLPISSAPAFSPQPVMAAPEYNVSGAATSAQRSTPVAAQPPPAPEKKYHEVKSPMVGTFYKRPSPDAPAYVQVGDVVRKGQVLCIVEAMKLMNEIQSDAAGKVVEVCLEDGQMAEYGEILFHIDSGS